MYAEGPDSPLFPSYKNLSYPIFPVTHPRWNISIIVGNLSVTFGLPISTIACSVKSLDPTKVIVRKAYKGADFAGYGFTTFLNASWNPTTGDLVSLTAAQTDGIMIDTPIEIFKIEVEGLAFTGSGVVVDIYKQEAYDIESIPNKVLTGDCPYDHTAYLLQVIQVIQPTAAFTFSPPSPYENDVVSFDATASAGGFDGNSSTNITAYQWDFGDLTPVANLTVNPTHSYTTAGAYNVNLTIFTDISGNPDPTYKQTASVVHTVMVFPKATGRAIDLFTDDWRYGDDATSYPTTFTGVNPPFASGSQVDSYSPQDLVCLYAKLTYNGEPISYKEVAFEIHGPSNVYQNISIYRQAMTNGSGIAEICFRIPWADIPNHAEAITFGAWGAIAKASVANQEVEDVHWWYVGWIVNIVSEHVSPNPVEELSWLNIYVDIHNYALSPRNFTLAVTLYDELGVPVGATTAALTNMPGGATWNLWVSIYVPEWAYVGIGTVYKDLFTRLPWVCGICYCPEQSESVIISPTDPHIPPF
jgi:hypothetical protein